MVVCSTGPERSWEIAPSVAGAARLIEPEPALSCRVRILGREGQSSSAIAALGQRHHRDRGDDTGARHIPGGCGRVAGGTDQPGHDELGGAAEQRDADGIGDRQPRGTDAARQQFGDRGIVTLARRAEPPALPIVRKLVTDLMCD